MPEFPVDLSTFHAPVSEFCPETVDRDRYRLSREQVEFYHENGYLAGVRILDDGQIGKLRDELDVLMCLEDEDLGLFYEYNRNESADPDRTLFHALGAWRVTPGLHDLLWHPGFTVPATQLLGGAVRLWHDQLFVKPAGHGSVVIWHQDYSYWTRTVPMAHLTCWIGLDDSTKANGCVHYVPKSHNWHLLPRESFANDMDKILDRLTPAQRREFKPVPIELKEGECSFHHPLMVHGSFANTSAGPRRAAIINVFRDGVRSASTEPLLAGVPSIAIGDKIEGRFFPLLCDPNQT